jgi:hypothetical protein
LSAKKQMHKKKISTQTTLTETAESYNQELAKYLPDSLLNQMKLVSDFKIPDEIQQNIGQLNSLGNEISDTNLKLNA